MERELAEPTKPASPRVIFFSLFAAVVASSVVVDLLGRAMFATCIAIAGVCVILLLHMVPAYADGLGRAPQGS